MTGEQPPLSSLERARVRAIYANAALIGILVLYNLFLHGTVDLGVLATLVGAELSLFGLGAVIRLVAPK